MLLGLRGLPLSQRQSAIYVEPVLFLSYKIITKSIILGKIKKKVWGNVTNFYDSSRFSSRPKISFFITRDIKLSLTSKLLIIAAAIKTKLIYSVRVHNLSLHLHIALSYGLHNDFRHWIRIGFKFARSRASLTGFK